MTKRAKLGRSGIDFKFSRLFVLQRGNTNTARIVRNGASIIIIQTSGMYVVFVVEIVITNHSE